MSLEDIKLPGFIIQDLFQKSLVEIVDQEKDTLNTIDKEISQFGGNRQHILLLVHDNNNAFVDETQLTFLTGILNACKLTLEDIALVNIYMSTASYKKLNVTLSPKIILMLGVTPDEIQLPFVMPEFQRQSYNGQVYIAAPSLTELENNKELKRKLWTVLQQLFSL